jgi:hypothetical protein
MTPRAVADGAMQLEAAVALEYLQSCTGELFWEGTGTLAL